MTGDVSGVFSIYFAEAVLLTIVVSFVLLVMYRRSVARRMRAAGLARPAPDDAGAPAPAPPLGRRDSDSPEPADRWWRTRLVVVYGFAGATAAAVLTTLFLVTRGHEVLPLRTFVTWYVVCWPVPLMLGALLAWPQRKVLLAFTVYLLAGAAVVLVWAVGLRLILGRADMAPFFQVYNLGLFLLLQAPVYRSTALRHRVDVYAAAARTPSWSARTCAGVR